MEYDPFIKCLHAGTIQIMAEHGVTCNRLHGCKAHEIAFKCGRNRREFEVKELVNGTYRFSTRYLGYKDAIEKFTGEKTTRIKDPDGRRYGFYIYFADFSTLENALSYILTNGFEEEPSISLI